MDDEQFGRLLQSFMFGTASPAERQRLVESALESSERGLEFARAEEIRPHLADPVFRQTLIATLPAVAAAERAASWRSWFRYDLLVPLVGGAAVVAGILFLADQRPDQGASGIASAPLREPPRELKSERPSPSGIDNAEPASTDSRSGADLAALFDLPQARAADIGLMLIGGPRYRTVDSVPVTVTLPAPGRMYAMVRGPAGHFREVYPVQKGDEDRVLAAGEHEFVFPAGGRMDPATGGRSTLRLFFVAASSSPVPPAGHDRWAWLAAGATFEESAYETAVP